MKRLFISTIISAISIIAMAQTQSVTHVVQRGETIESIAEYYHVSVADINKANPNAEGLVYVGMKLVVPVRQGQVDSSAEASTPNTANVVDGKTYNAQTIDGLRQSNVSANSKDASPWDPAFEIGYGFIKGKSNFQYEATFGVNYRFPFNMYAGARIGYNSCNYNGYVKEYNMTTKVQYHFIEIPLELGYALATSNGNWAILPFAGINTNIGLTGKLKSREIGSDENEGKMKIGGKVGFEARLGLRIRLMEFNITGSYRIPLSDKQKGWAGKDAYPEITIGWGF